MANDGNGSGDGATTIIALPTRPLCGKESALSLLHLGGIFDDHLHHDREEPGESRSLGLEERHIFLIRKCTTRCSGVPPSTPSPCFNKGFSRVWENNLLRGRERKGPSTTMTKLNGRLTTEISLAAVAAVRPHSIQSDVFIFLHLLVGRRRRRRSLVCLQQPLKKDLMLLQLPPRDSRKLGHAKPTKEGGIVSERMPNSGRQARSQGGRAPSG